jgi:hypothetical protein
LASLFFSYHSRNFSFEFFSLLLFLLLFFEKKIFFQFGEEHQEEHLQQCIEELQMSFHSEEERQTKPNEESPSPSPDEKPTPASEKQREKGGLPKRLGDIPGLSTFKKVLAGGVRLPGRQELDAFSRGGLKLLQQQLLLQPPAPNVAGRARGGDLWRQGWGGQIDWKQLLRSPFGGGGAGPGYPVMAPGRG